MKSSSLHQNTELVLHLCGLQTKLQKRLDHSLFAHGISFTEFMVMNYLMSSPNKSMRRIDLAESIGVTASGVTRLLNPMQKIGLVEKGESTRDARVSLVKLTGPGEELFSNAKTAFDECCDSFLEPLSKSQQTSLSTILAALI